MLIRQDDDYTLLELHDSDTGRPVLLRQKFMIVAFRASDKDYTEITMDGLQKNHMYHVREMPADINGPFAKIANVTFNPDYFLGLGVNTGDNKNNHSFEYRLRGNPVLSFTTSRAPENIKAAIQQARMLRP